MGIIQLSNKMTDLDYKTVNNIKALAIDMINEAQSGHPGIALSCAPILYTLYAKHLVFDPKNDKWINRDRFVMSAGHGSSVLYSTLFMSGFNLTIDDLRAFRSINSKTPGHPVLDKTPGVDFSTGPLGQGIASAVGMAIAERFLNKRYSYTKKNSLIDHYTYCLCGDGDLMEGVSYEACSMAGLLGLGKLIVLYDSNNMTLDGPRETSSNEKVLERFRAMNWDVHQVNGNDLNAIDVAISKAKSRKDKPSLIEVKTILGLGSKLENTNLVHGKPLEEDDITLLKEKLEIRDIPFTVVSECYNKMTEEVLERNYKIIDKYNSLYEFKNKKISNFKVEFENLKNNNFKMNIDFSPTAAAGIAFVKAKFPFSTAYNIAEACCKNSKSMTLKRLNLNGITKNSIDFQVCHSDMSGDLASYREKNYIKDGCNLIKRPYIFFDDGDYSYEKFKDLCETLENAMVGKLIARSKLKGLRNSYGIGKIAAENYGRYIKAHAEKNGPIIDELSNPFDESGQAKFFDYFDIMDIVYKEAVKDE